MIRSFMTDDSDVIRMHPAGHAVIDDADDVAVCSQLRRLADIVDSLWNDALASATHGEAVRLGEASLGLHRALIALDGFRHPEFGDAS